MKREIVVVAALEFGREFGRSVVAFFTKCSVPDNLTRLGAERSRDVITKAELRSKDKESGEGSIASVDKPGEEVSSMFVDIKRLKLKEDLNCTMKDGEDK